MRIFASTTVSGREVQTTARYAHLARDTVKASAALIGDSIERDLGVSEAMSPDA